MPEQREITGIQYLRGLAALAVVVDHGAGMARLPKYLGSGASEPLLIDAARLGVDVFFLISGFIIAIVSLHGRSAAPAIRIGDFFRRRFLRIVPLMWIAIVTFALVRLVSVHVAPWDGYWRAMLLWPFGKVAPTHIWTLRVEAIFYAVFALTMLTRGRYRPLILLWIAAPILLYRWLPGLANTPLGLIADLHNLEFGAGLGLGLLWLRRGDSRTIRAPSFGYWIVCLAFAVVVFTISGLTDLLGRGLLRMILMLPALAVLLWAAARVQFADGPSHRIGDLLGNASYSIYLFHPPIISGFLVFTTHLTPRVDHSIIILGSVLVSTGGGIALHFLLERPLLAWLRRRFLKPSRPRPLQEAEPVTI